MVNRTVEFGFGLVSRFSDRLSRLIVTNQTNFVFKRYTLNLISIQRYEAKLGKAKKRVRMTEVYFRILSER